MDSTTLTTIILAATVIALALAVARATTRGNSGPQRIQLRRGDSAEWAASNPVLADGEPGWDSTAKVLKVGDGSTPWGDLPPLMGVTRTP